MMEEERFTDPCYPIRPLMRQIQLRKKSSSITETHFNQLNSSNCCLNPWIIFPFSHLFSPYGYVVPQICKFTLTITICSAICNYNSDKLYFFFTNIILRNCCTVKSPVFHRFTLNAGEQFLTLGWFYTSFFFIWSLFIKLDLLLCFLPHVLYSKSIFYPLVVILLHNH